MLQQNVTAFLMDQNRQFDEVIHGLKYAKDSLDPARLRNHDLLTSLDVLTTGSYRRLPSAIKVMLPTKSPQHSLNSRRKLLFRPLPFQQMMCEKHSLMWKM